MTQRIINNKHYGNSELITRDKFLSEGEIVISNEVGFEGIYILNTRGDVVKIGSKNQQDSGSTIPPGDYVDAEFVRNYLIEHAYTTSAQTVELLSPIETAIAELNDKVDNIEIPSGFTPDVVDLTDVYDKIAVLSGLTAEIVTEEQVRDIVTNEIAFLVSSADTMFDALRALADWITNDETGSAQLIADVVNVKESVSGLTDRVSALETEVNGINTELSDIESDVDDIADSVIELSGSVVEHIAQNEADLQELNDKVDAIEIPEIPEPVSDEHIRDIAAQEVASLVSSADTMYQVLQELADWVENDTTGSAQLIADVGELKDAVSANTSAIESVNEQVENAFGILDVHQDDIDTLYERVEAVEDAIENIPSAVTPSSGSSIDEETINALKAYIDEKIASIKFENDHVFLSRRQYSELISTGQVTIKGVVYYYSDDIYYCIYEDAAPTPDSGSSSGSSYEYDEESGTIELSGNTVIEDGMVEIAVSIDEDGYVTITEPEPIPDEEPEIDEDGFVEISEDQIDEDGYVNIPDNWEEITN